jgi:metacaspase-1
VQSHPSYSAPLPDSEVQGKFSQFRASGRKRALLIGICYDGTPAELAGCANDVKHIHYLLSTKFGFQQSDFVIMTDRVSEIPKTVRKGPLPTRANIIHAMKNLVAGVKPGDSLFFQFSGHGSQIADTSGDEVDGLDETILPLDHKKAGQITDDEMYDILVRGIPKGARLTVLFDCCHSGTGLDLPYTHDVLFPGSGSIVDGGGPVHAVMAAAAGVMGAFNHGGPVAAAMHAAKTASDVVLRKKLRPHKANENAGEVLLFSGCLDNQFSADTNALTGNTVTGAMTFCFVEAIEHGSVGDWQNYTYRGLLQTMRVKLVETGLKQTPQFSTSHPFDLRTPFYV